MRSIIGRIQDDRVAGDPQVVNGLEQLADVPVVFDHSIGILGLGGQPRRARRSAATCVRRCIRVLLYQQKNGLPAAVWRLM